MTLTAELKKYSQDVLKNKPLSCKKHKWACRRFLSDLKRSAANDPTFPYVFNEVKANRFLTWMTFFKHRKGVLKGQRIQPHIIQKFIFGNVYGWIHKKTGYRRFKKMYWQVARKNAKSQSLALVGLFETMGLDEEGIEMSEVYCAATKKGQASIVYKEAVAMLDKSDYFKNKKKYYVAYDKINHVRTGSIMTALSKGDQTTGDGPNPQCGIVDEYHAHTTTEIYDVIDSGMGARAQPLMAIITTAGFDLDNPCHRIEYDLVSKILDPNIPVNIESYFCMVNELDKDINGKLLDNIKNPKVWVKANPIICSFPEGIEYLKTKLEEILIEPEKLRNFLTKHMNIWIMNREQGYMDMSKWALCVATKKNVFPDLKGMPTIPGFDLSSRIDLCSLGFETVMETGIIAVTHHSFIPEDMVRQKEKTDSMPYSEWIEGGWITATPGSEVDYHYILEYIEKLWKANKWNMGEACFDKALATWLTHEITELGFMAVEIPQSYTGLSEATKDFRGKVYNKKVIQNEDPVLTWAISNAVTRIGPSGNILLDKSKSKKRIDPIAAVINAHTRTMAIEDEGVYNKRGMRTFAT